MAEDEDNREIDAELLDAERAAELAARAEDEIAALDEARERALAEAEDDLARQMGRLEDEIE